MKILYLLFAVFCLMLQSTTGITDPRQCIGHGEFCSIRCHPPSRQIGICAIGIPCCKR
uniref:Beta-defensin-like domain-containing protein n=1 Tax=Gopherus agassizii TaxID=38772 RepID=A0A452IDS0_9SAUR